MLSDVEMLNDIRQNVQMGCHGIDEIMPYVKDEKFRKVLETQKQEYGNIFEEADRLLHERKEKPEDISVMSKLSSKTMTMIQTMKDPSSQHVAEMRWQASAVGIARMRGGQRE